MSTYVHVRRRFQSALCSSSFARRLLLVPSCIRTPKAHPPQHARSAAHPEGSHHRSDDPSKVRLPPNTTDNNVYLFVICPLDICILCAGRRTALAEVPWPPALRPGPADPGCAVLQGLWDMHTIHNAHWMYACILLYTAMRLGSSR